MSIELLLAAALVSGTPILLAALGELLSERAGVLNLGVEGTMLIGAVSGFAAASTTASVWAGVLGALLAGALFGLAFASLVVSLRLNQIVTGPRLHDPRHRPFRVHRQAADRRAAGARPCRGSISARSPTCRSWGLCCSARTRWSTLAIGLTAADRALHPPHPARA